MIKNLGAKPLEARGEAASSYIKEKDENKEKHNTYKGKIQTDEPSKLLNESVIYMKYRSRKSYFHHSVRTDIRTD